MKYGASHTLAVSVMLLCAPPSLAQVTPEEHAAHHPDEAASNETPGEGEAPQSQVNDMGAMMEQMGVPKPLDLYPSLMNMPELSLKEREEVHQLAQTRMQSGIALMTDSLEQISRSVPDEDFEVMQAAAVVFREGFAQFESALATRQALRDGTRPSEIALDWFRREMNIIPQHSGQTSGPLGLSWFHFLTMMILLVFTSAMIWIQYLKMRRTSSLVRRLADINSSSR